MVALIAPTGRRKITTAKMAIRVKRFEWPQSAELNVKLG
jgi:hypothetical protein